MNKILRRVGLCLIILLGFRTTMAEDYRWIVTYPTATNEWGRKMASGENKVVMKAQFVNLNSEKKFELRRFAVRPTTTAPQDSSWNDYINYLQLWQNTDDYPGSLDKDNDSLINSNSKNVSIQTSDNPSDTVNFNLPGGKIDLADTSTFFVTMLVKDWHDGYPENQEITDQNGIKFGVTVVKDTADDSKSDLRVAISGDFNDSSNSWGGNPLEQFEIRAVNLEVTLRNDSTSECIFYPEFLPIADAPENKAQIISDLNFVTNVYLPNMEEDFLSYASLKVGWDNNLLELDSMWYGEIWDNKQYDTLDSGSGYNVSYVPGDTNYYEVRFEGIVIASPNYVDLLQDQASDKYLVSLKFKILKPGISPIFLSDIVILDQWGIPYHTYRMLRNEMEETAEKYDAWSKLILGDFTSSDSSDTLISQNGNGDAEVTWADISLFGSHIWMNSDSADWYSRFDIGSQDSHNPDKLSPDDTTNFFDLMVMGTNYYRTWNDAFSQKPVALQENPVEINFTNLQQKEKSDEYYAKISMQNVTDLISTQAKFRYNPEQLEFVEMLPGDWVKNISSSYVMLYPTELIEKGVVDINFLSLNQPLSGEGDFATLKFKMLDTTASDITLDYLDLRDMNCDKIEYSVNTNKEIKTIPDEYFLLENFPNPFNPITNIHYTIPDSKDDIYQIRIYDILGNQIVTLENKYHNSGEYNISWSGKNQNDIPVVSGLYFIHFSGGKYKTTQKITLIR